MRLSPLKKGLNKVDEIDFAGLSSVELMTPLVSLSNREFLGCSLRFYILDPFLPSLNEKSVAVGIPWWLVKKCSRLVSWERLVRPLPRLLQWLLSQADMVEHRGLELKYV